MKDLAKILEALMKPILYIKKPQNHQKEKTTHVFYIIDNNTKYQYKTKISLEIAEKEKAKMEKPVLV